MVRAGHTTISAGETYDHDRSELTLKSGILVLSLVLLFRFMRKQDFIHFP